MGFSSYLTVISNKRIHNEKIQSLGNVAPAPYPTRSNPLQRCADFWKIVNQ